MSSADRQRVTVNALAIRAAGMVTSVGFNAPATCAAIRAGVRNVAETNLWDKYSGTYLPAGRVQLPHWWVGLGKLAELVTPAIKECFDAVPLIPPSDIPVLLGVAGRDRPFRFDGIESQLLPEIAERLKLRLHPASAVIASDRVSAVVGLRQAENLIRRNTAALAIVAGVDSLLDQRLVDYYLDKRRLLTPLDSNGFCVGEAGAAILIGTTDETSEGELALAAADLDLERATVESEEPLRGEAMTRLIRAVLAQAGITIQNVNYRIADLNGEHYRFKEMVLAMGRFARTPTRRLFDVWHPIEYIGEVGAAIGPIVLALALHAGRNGYGNGPTALCTFGNDDGARAAVVTTYVERAA